MQKVMFCAVLALTIAEIVASPVALAGPSAEVARKCMHYSYVAYPYKRPGSVKMSGDRQSYFKDCMTKDGNVLEPAAPKQQ